MSTDPFAGYIGHPLKTVTGALKALYKGYTIESVPEGTNVTPGSKPKRFRVYYNSATKLTTRVVAG